MQLLVVRHALAEEREIFVQTGKPDDMRPLTSKGKSKMRKNAQGIVKLVPHINVLATSPLVRAMQTSEILLKEYLNTPQETLAALSPRGAKQAVLTWLQAQPTQNVIALIGHEPDLGELVSWFLSLKIYQCFPLNCHTPRLL